MAETTFVPQSPYQAFLQSPIAANTRITLVSGQPVMTSSVLAATQVFVTPYLGSRIPFYNPAATEWRSELFTEMAISLALGTGAQQVTTASNYDVYAWLSGGRPVAALSPAWASDTSIGTNPGSAERLGLGGIVLNRWDINGGPPSMRGTYLGTIRTGSSAAVDWQFGALANSCTAGIHCVYNYFNRRLVSSKIGENVTLNWTWTSNAYRAINGQSTNARVSAIVGVNEDVWKVFYSAKGIITVATTPLVGVGLDQMTTSSALSIPGSGAANSHSVATALFEEQVPVGFHFWSLLEASANQNSTVTFIGGATTAANFQCGATYAFWM